MTSVDSRRDYNYVYVIQGLYRFGAVLVVLCSIKVDLAWCYLCLPLCLLAGKGGLAGRGTGGPGDFNPPPPPQKKKKKFQGGGTPTRFLVASMAKPIVSIDRRIVFFCKFSGAY